MEQIVRRRPGRPGEAPLRCAVTGHRPQKCAYRFNESDPRCVDFKARLYAYIEYLIGQGYGHFLSGGALGMDMYAAEAVLALKRRYPWIGLELVIPHPGQENAWPEALAARYRSLVAQADILTYTASRYSPFCMSRRNRYLVQHADLLLAAFDGQPGGTRSTVLYAERQHVPVIVIDPAPTENTAQPVDNYA